ncbi:GNAT family N-acetyltransferase [Leifsonia sp. NPDC058292]|uniref:GNAT family N-acetyltransferase n=1 Tax=Leifsonia sp. NPDC058292 TaxID=3346428 RepID=UPI0036DE7044
MSRIQLDRQRGVNPPSVYFSYEYGTAGLSGGASWVCLHDETGAWQLPVILAPIGESGRYEATSPYGYTGIRISPSVSPDDSVALWAEAVERLREIGVVSLFLRFAPFDPVSAERSGVLDGIALRHASHTVLVPTIAEEQVWSGMRGRARTSVRKAKASGLTARFEAVRPHHVAPGSPFRRLYAETMDRVGAASHYHFTDEYFESLASDLCDELYIASVDDASGDTVAASLVLADSRTMHYHLSGSTPAGARAGANNLLIWHILTSAIAHGRGQVHLGGGVTPNDSLFAFKSAFGGDVVPFFVGSSVIDPVAYGDLVRLRAEELGTPAARLLESDYFPAFRAGTVSA